MAVGMGLPSPAQAVLVCRNPPPGFPSQGNPRYTGLRCALKHFLAFSSESILDPAPNARPRPTRCLAFLSKLAMPMSKEWREAKQSKIRFITYPLLQL